MMKNLVATAAVILIASWCSGQDKPGKGDATSPVADAGTRVSEPPRRVEDELKALQAEMAEQQAQIARQQSEIGRLEQQLRQKASDQPVGQALPDPQPQAVASLASQASSTQATRPAAPSPVESKPAGPTVVSAIVPVRVLPLDPPVKDGLIPGFKLGGVKVTPYGFIKATVARDSSAPNGDDFPFPGIFLNSSSPFSTGPTDDPSFHLKARASRFERASSGLTCPSP